VSFDIRRAVRAEPDNCQGFWYIVVPKASSWHGTTKIDFYDRDHGNSSDAALSAARAAIPRILHDDAVEEFWNALDHTTRDRARREFGRSDQWDNFDSIAHWLYSVDKNKSSEVRSI
jgi:hypothetical protein